ncbi:MAG: hypothetical protein R3B57_12860 [Phycisphaerales bacterium]
MSDTSMRDTTTRRVLAGLARRTLPGAAAGLALLATASTALAQATPKPPQPRDDPTAPVIMTLLTLVILALATLFAAAFPSKRGHQD